MKWLLLFITLTMVGCAPRQTLNGSVKLIFVNSDFRDYVQSGRTVLVYPVVMDSNFLKTPSYDNIKLLLRARGDDILPYSYQSYIDTIKTKKKLKILRPLEKNIKIENIIDIPPLISFFDQSPIKFLLVFRVRKAIKVTGTNGVAAKHLTLSGELWDITQGGVVWRANSDLENLSTISDTKMVEDGIKLLLTSLPKFYHDSEQRDW